MPDETESPSTTPEQAAPPAAEPQPARRIPLSPRARKLVAFGVLAAGALFVANTLMPVAPREVEVRVRLAQFRAPPDTARAITVEFVRRSDGSPVRAVVERFRGTPPVEWRQTVTLPPGAYAASVNVELEGRSALRESQIEVGTGGEAVELPAPRPP